MRLAEVINELISYNGENVVLSHKMSEDQAEPTELHRLPSGCWVVTSAQRNGFSFHKPDEMLDAVAEWLDCAKKW